MHMTNPQVAAKQNPYPSRGELGASAIEYVLLACFALLVSTAVANFGQHLSKSFDHATKTALALDGGGTDHTKEEPGDPKK